MTANKQRRKVIEGLQKEVDKHLKKIADQLAKPVPDQGLIDHWNSEVRGWLKQIQKHEARLP
jgi:hypothetical protein